jgi:hypothetical protein
MAEVAPITCRLKTGETALIRTGVESDAASMRECVLAYIENGEGQLWERGEFNPTEEQEREWIKGMRENPCELKIRISNRLHPAPRGAQMGWNRVMPEVMRSFFADFRAWPKPYFVSSILTVTSKFKPCSVI